MTVSDEVAQDLEQALRQTVALCEQIFANTQQGLNLLQHVLFGGGAETYFQALADFSVRSLAAAQRYNELQFEWAMHGF